MQVLYSFIVFLASGLLQIIALFNPKLKLFVSGRKDTFSKVKKALKLTDKVVWIHAASLGEFEQGRPIIESIKEKYPTHKIVLTFFSPSGYEVQKNYSLADVITYLPLDTVSNAKQFLKIVNPTVAIFVKYEIWPNLLTQLKKQNIPTVLVSGIFRSNQIFFKAYGIWMRSKLKAFSYFFLQDDNSEKLLNNIGCKNTAVVGDTRFDRVYAILERDNSLDFINAFKGDSYVTVAGSTWPEDEANLIDYIENSAGINEKFIIAPHNIKGEGIADLYQAFGEKAVLFSEKAGKDLSKYKVFIIDTIGILTKIYAVADVAYVGGGYTKSGIHNILEPATFGVPVVIGPNYKKFNEAHNLVSLGACLVTHDAISVKETLVSIYGDEALRANKGKIAGDYIKNSLGATDKIVAYLKTFLK